MLPIITLVLLLSSISSAYQRKILMLFWDTPDNALAKEPIEVPSGVCLPMNDPRAIDFADVVVFYMHFVAEPPVVERPWGALWVFQVRESPATFNHRYQKFLDTMNAQLNLYMSYDSAANISTPYGGYVPGSTFYPFQTAYFHKRALAVALISDCASPSRSESLKRMNRYIHIDVMGQGSCGTMAIIPECMVQGEDQRGCFHALARDYFFYFAVENSDCKDYITEKVWMNAFIAGMIPIVDGKFADYAKHLPPKSFINCADFASAEDCTSHILAVAKDVELYNSYHAWKRSYSVIRRGDNYDQLCEMALNNRGRERGAINVAQHRDQGLCAFSFRT